MYKRLVAVVVPTIDDVGRTQDAEIFEEELNKALQKSGMEKADIVAELTLESGRSETEAPCLVVIGSIEDFDPIAPH
jgi:hypothetical protein